MAAFADKILIILGITNMIIDEEMLINFCIYIINIDNFL